ncbi:MAG TPA: hypothetical protein DFS52_01510 [Myxococcales bacterium]|nr:hypothetical protein [Myxococcales bacterium]
MWDDASELFEDSDDPPEVSEDSPEALDDWPEALDDWPEPSEDCSEWPQDSAEPSALPPDAAEDSAELPEEAAEFPEDSPDCSEELPLSAVALAPKPWALLMEGSPTPPLRAVAHPALHPNAAISSRQRGSIRPLPFLTESPLLASRLPALGPEAVAQSTPSQSRPREAAL